jgi:hypothetical protein
MDIEKAYSTHEISRGPKNLKLLLARNRHGLWRCTIRFYDAYLISFVFLYLSQDSLSSGTVHKFDSILAKMNR